MTNKYQTYTIYTEVANGDCTNNTYSTLVKKNNKLMDSVSYLNIISRISQDNIWILCGSHKFWKHKYNQLFTVNWTIK